MQRIMPEVENAWIEFLSIHTPTTFWEHKRQSSIVIPEACAGAPATAWLSGIHAVTPVAVC
jgi:hypothetical protein